MAFGLKTLANQINPLPGGKLGRTSVIIGSLALGGVAIVASGGAAAPAFAAAASGTTATAAGTAATASASSALGSVASAGLSVLQHAWITVSSGGSLAYDIYNSADWVAVGQATSDLGSALRPAV